MVRQYIKVKVTAHVDEKGITTISYMRGNWLMMQYNSATKLLTVILDTPEYAGGGKKTYQFPCDKPIANKKIWKTFNGIQRLHKQSYAAKTAAYYKERMENAQQLMKEKVLVLGVDNEVNGGSSTDYLRHWVPNFV